MFDKYCKRIETACVIIIVFLARAGMDISPLGGVPSFLHTMDRVIYLPLGLRLLGLSCSNGEVAGHPME